jgi:hypothetical protein
MYVLPATTAPLACLILLAVLRVSLNPPKAHLQSALVKLAFLGSIAHRLPFAAPLALPVPSTRGSTPLSFRIAFSACPIIFHHPAPLFAVAAVLTKRRRRELHLAISFLVCPQPSIRPSSSATLISKRLRLSLATSFPLYPPFFPFTNCASLFENAYKS